MKLSAAAVLPAIEGCSASAVSKENTFPGTSWGTRSAAEAGLDPDKLAEISKLLGGRGCVVYRGSVAASWGSQSHKSDWMSSCKPVISTLLFFAIQEGKVRSVDEPIRNYGWALTPKDRAMTWRHLANMTSGYARPEPPGVAWAYNDYAIMLYQKTLFEKVYGASATDVAADASRLGALNFEDGLSFSRKARLKASVRDFSRLCWFWLNKGRWAGKQLLRNEFFADYVRPCVPENTPHTVKAETDDYLGIGSYGGGSDHFTRFGPGIYGFNFWFNAIGREHPDVRTWPDAPTDAFMTIGAGGNSSVMIPGLGVTVVAAEANWGKLEPGSHDSQMNRVMLLLRQAVKGAKTK